MYSAEDIARVFERIAPLDSGVPGDQLGFVYGNPTTEVRGIACLWNVHSQSLRLCAEQDAQHDHLSRRNLAPVTDESLV